MIAGWGATGDGGRRERSQRQQRAGEEIRHILAELLTRRDFRDPALRDLVVTVTEVRLSPDLRNATVFFTPFGGGDASAALLVLQRAAPALRTRLAREIRLRHTPALSFTVDRSFDEAERVRGLLLTPMVAADIASPLPMVVPEEEAGGTQT